METSFGQVLLWSKSKLPGLFSLKKQRFIEKRNYRTTFVRLLH
jgi:hypothetical protein